MARLGYMGQERPEDFHVPDEFGHLLVARSWNSSGGKLVSPINSGSSWPLPNREDPSKTQHMKAICTASGRHQIYLKDDSLYDQLKKKSFREAQDWLKKNLGPSEYQIMEHRAPMSGCTCGIWACTHPRNLPGGDTQGVMGIWGKIRRGTTGWRAEYAKPIGFVVSASSHDLPALKKLATNYDAVLYKDWDQVIPHLTPGWNGKD